MKTASYKGETIYVSIISSNEQYALVSKSKDLTKLFRVELSELSNFNFKL